MIYISLSLPSRILTSPPFLGNLTRTISKAKYWALKEKQDVSESQPDSISNLMWGFIFPDPVTFNLERWIDNSSLSRYIHGRISRKGSRRCIGYDLIYVVLYLCLDTVVGRCGIKGVDSPAKLSSYNLNKVPNGR